MDANIDDTARSSIACRRDQVRGGGRVLTIGLFGLALLVSVGCEKTVDKPPQTAAKQARHDETNRAPAYPEHVAPPPAYGNKVVMASAESDRAGQF